MSRKTGDLLLGDCGVQREQFFLGVCAKSQLRLGCPWTLSSDDLWWWHFSQHVRSDASEPSHPCYIFLHSFPPVLLFMFSKEQESVANTQSKVGHVPNQTVVSKKLPVPSLSVNLWYISCGKRREPTWRKMRPPQWFSFCYSFSTPTFWMVSKRLSCSLSFPGVFIWEEGRIHHSPLAMQLQEMKMSMSFAAIKLFTIFWGLKRMQKLRQKSECN